MSNASAGLADGAGLLEIGYDAAISAEHAETVAAEFIQPELG
jgi:hypothetical protein